MPLTVKICFFISESTWGWPAGVSSLRYIARLFAVCRCSQIAESRTANWENAVGANGDRLILPPWSRALAMMYAPSWTGQSRQQHVLSVEPARCPTRQQMLDDSAASTERGCRRRLCVRSCVGSQRENTNSNTNTQGTAGLVLEWACLACSGFWPVLMWLLFWQATY